MSMGRRQKSQSPLWIAHDEISPGPGHRFCETLNKLLREAAFGRHAEALCALLRCHACPRTKVRGPRRLLPDAPGGLAVLKRAVPSRRNSTVESISLNRQRVPATEGTGVSKGRAMQRNPVRSLPAPATLFTRYEAVR